MEPCGEVHEALWRVHFSVAAGMQDGLFMIAFPEARGAVEWTVIVQLALLKYVFTYA